MSDSIDVVITPAAINQQHGTGPLVQRLFKGRPNIFSIRSTDLWGSHEFGAWNAKIPQAGHSRPESFRAVLQVLGGRKVNTVTCVPYLIDDLMTAIAVKEAFDAKLCAYLMDDQNVAAEVIPDAVMREVLEKCSLRLVTHPELRQAYQSKYRMPFFLLPAVVPEEAVADRPVPPPASQEGRRGALLGSFWHQSWVDRLCSALSSCCARIDWYGNNTNEFLRFDPEELARAGITAHGLIPEPQLAEELRKYPFVLVPVGAMDGGEDNTGVASLSLPGRILFALAAAHVPILVVGSEKTCASRLVASFGVGETVPYDAAKLASAMDRLSSPEVQKAIRARAAAIGPWFSDAGVVEWLATSIEKGSPADNRFEDVFAGYPRSSALGRL